jgi:hypothetical protein
MQTITASVISNPLKNDEFIFKPRFEPAGGRV